MEYTLIRSKRKTLSLQVTDELVVLVRAPLRCPKGDIDSFVEKHKDWIARNLDLRRRQAAAQPDKEELARMKALAREYIPPRVEHYGRIMGLTPSAVKITAAKTRHGSCSPKNSLCFSCRLMGFPEAAIDYVVVHELAHITHKNHGPLFYALVASVLPDYKARRAMLKGRAT